jgi:SAM-dependent methyltransferase
MSEAPASPRGGNTIRPAHPLAQRLIERLREARGSRILDFGCGSGRNTAALLRAGFAVTAIDDGAANQAPAGLTERFAAVLSTHGLLHGTTPSIELRLRAIAGLLDLDGLLFASFGSSHDARFGDGERVAADTYVPTHGDERGVAHTFLRRAQVRALLESHFVIELLEEHGVDEIAGSWAHPNRLSGAVHWFAVARKR